jgi:ribosomal protein L29
MKKKSTTTMNSSEIEKNLADLREKLRVIRFGLVGGRTKNVKDVGNFRREIARLETQKKSLGATK